jgi:hypothetical protein
MNPFNSTLEKLGLRAKEAPSLGCLAGKMSDPAAMNT